MSQDAVITVLTVIVAFYVSWHLPALIRLLARPIQISFPKRKRRPRRPAPPQGQLTVFESLDNALDLPTSDSIDNPKKAEAISVLVALRSSSDAGLPRVIGRLRRMNAYAFEELVAICLAERGLRARCTPGYSRDGGIDGWGFWNGKPVVIQAKRWNKHICNRDIVSLAEVAGRSSGVGLFVHTGKTGRLARKQAAMNHINLISGERLVALVLGSALSLHWREPDYPTPAESSSHTGTAQPA